MAAPHRGAFSQPRIPGKLAARSGTAEARRREQGAPDMLMTFVVVLIVLWLLGMVTSYTLGGILHVLLVIAVIMLLIRLIRGQGI
jgi:hypothetical protein